MAPSRRMYGSLFSFSIFCTSGIDLRSSSRPSATMPCGAKPRWPLAVTSRNSGAAAL